MSFNITGNANNITEDLTYLRFHPISYLRQFLKFKLKKEKKEVGK